MTTDLTLDEALAPPDLPRKEYRLGIIQLSARLAELWDISINATDVQGKLRDDGVFARLHKTLLLPGNYSIMGIFYKPYMNMWEVCVESPDLPIYEQDGSEPPTVTPWYNRNHREDGTAYTQLLEIRIREGVLDYRSLVLIEELGELKGMPLVQGKGEVNLHQIGMDDTLFRCAVCGGEWLFNPLMFQDSPNAEKRAIAHCPGKDGPKDGNIF